jgi:hypothetical protein
VISEELQKIFPFVVECKPEILSHFPSVPPDQDRAELSRADDGRGRTIRSGAIRCLSCAAPTWRPMCRRSTVRLAGGWVIEIAGIQPLLTYCCEGNLWAATTWERFLALLAEQAEQQLRETA